MKKLILTAAIILGAMSVQATNTANKIVIIHSTTAQEEYIEVTADAVPMLVKSTIEKSFPGTKLEKAYKNEKNEYKLELSKESSKFTVFTDASGNIIKK